MTCEVISKIRSNNPNCEIFGEPYPPPPIDACSSDMYSVYILAFEWLRNDCQEANGWCGEIDLNRDGYVNFVDLSYIAALWMKEEVYW